MIAAMERREILRRISVITAPGQMTKREALEFLEYLGDDIDASIDALKDEVNAEEEEDN